MDGAESTQSEPTNTIGNSTSYLLANTLKFLCAIVRLNLVVLNHRISAISD